MARMEPVRYMARLGTDVTVVMLKKLIGVSVLFFRQTYGIKDFKRWWTVKKHYGHYTINAEFEDGSCRVWKKYDP